MSTSWHQKNEIRHLNGYAELQEMEREMKGTMVRSVCALVMAITLASCTTGDIENGASGAAKNWCRNSPKYCSVNDDIRGEF